MRRRLLKLWEAIRLVRMPHYELVKWSAAYLNSLGATRSFVERRPLTSDGEPLPWMTYPAIEYLSQLDLRDAFVFEYGSGNGSLFWASRARKVVSIEDNSEWIEELRPRCRANQTIRFAPERSQYVCVIKELDETPDIVVIDGKYRRECAGFAAHAVSLSGMIILDNSDWHPKTCEFLTGQGFTQLDFIGHGPINAYTWATSVFLRSSSGGSFKRLVSAPRAIGGVPQFGDETC